MAILSCFTSGKAMTKQQPSRKRVLTEKETAIRILNTILNADKTTTLRQNLNDQVPKTGWTEPLARHLFDNLILDLNSNAVMGKVAKDSHSKAAFEAEKLVHRYSNLLSATVSVVAMGMLTMLVPEAMTALGLAQREPVEGSFAKIWQLTYSNIPYGIFYGCLQRVGSVPKF